MSTRPRVAPIRYQSWLPETLETRGFCSDDSDSDEWDAVKTDAGTVRGDTKAEQDDRSRIKVLVPPSSHRSCFSRSDRSFEVVPPL